MTSKKALEMLLSLSRPCDYEVKEHRKIYCDMLEKVIKKDLDRLEKLEKAKTPTLEEVIKTWEVLGYVWSEYSSVIHLCYETSFITETIIINKEDYSYYRLVNDSLDPIDLKEHKLLTKTFKALGWIEDDN